MSKGYYCNRNFTLFTTKNNPMTKQTWLNLRAEYIDELAYQFQLREKPSDKRNDVFIEKSAKRCRAYDYLIQSHANIFDKKTTDSIQ